jgi:hypothetical protein
MPSERQFRKQVFQDSHVLQAGSSCYLKVHCSVPKNGQICIMQIIDLKKHSFTNSKCEWKSNMVKGPSKYRWEIIITSALGILFIQFKCKMYSSELAV